MITFTLVLVAAAVALGLSMRVRIPANVLAILAGVSLQALAVPVDSEVVRDGLLMAGAFLVFSVGAAIERRPLVAYWKNALALSLLTLLVTGGVGWALWVALDLAAWTAAYWVLALFASSTLLVFDLLQRREQLFDPLGRVVSATSLMQDLVVVIVLTIFAALGRTPEEAVTAVAGTVAIIVTAGVLSRWVGPFVMLRLGLDAEERLLFILLVLFGLSGLARWSGGALVTGAYFAGLAISRFPVGDLTRGYLKSFSDFFSIVFFVMLGLVVTVPSPSAIVVEVVFASILLLVRPVVLLPMVRRGGLTVRSSIEAVMLLAQAGELAVVVAIVGLELGQVDENTLGVVAGVVVITMSVVPWLSSERVVWALTGAYPLRGRSQLPTRPSGHVIVIGAGETGSALLDRLDTSTDQLVVIEDDPAVVRALLDRKIAVLRGDGADAEILAAAGAERALAVVSTMRHLDGNARLLSAVRGPRVFVRVFSEAEAEQIRRLGGHPLVEAAIAAEAFVQWCRTSDLAEARPVPR